jgi:hypothetical protein
MSKNFLTNTFLYFKAFQNRDVKSLKDMYSSNVTLLDWDNNISGKQNVLDLNKELFKEIFTLNVISSKQVGNQTFNEITIKIDINKYTTVLNILDVITFNDQFRIENITAYKR